MTEDLIDRLIRNAGVVVPLAIACVAPARAQFGNEPKPVPGRAVATWQVEQMRPPMNFGIRLIYARNDTTVPIVITRIRFSKCVNLRIACEPVAMASEVIAPGGTTEIMRVLPADLGQWHAALAGIAALSLVAAGGSPLEPGDLVELEAEGIGVLANRIV